ncbi:MAG: bifunctional phosphopantothenoylcysteine decarboxylase/phosphopantothenate--cysteine ligase CoaBC [Rhodobacteraceae bacterium]|nr:bifunctional phosphopantothenoylcysteine decarboxylase/phosphopantothenate--cysteine ligase CoaBC [Paracoccaceae bacterium]
MSLEDSRILLIIGGGIAAYKSLDLIRRLRERGARVRAVMTEGARQFITPMSVGALTGDKVFCDLFDRDDEHDVGHIRLSREADLVIVAPATADLMAKMATGLAGDLATAVLLACDKPVLLAPAMNPAMWTHPATRRNSETLAADGIHFVGPGVGEMAERGEAGVGRMSEPLEIVAAAERVLRGEAGHPPAQGPLSGRHVLITSGPTHEPIDPVRYIANRSSGKQGHAIAAEMARAGARVTLVSGPVTLADPPGVDVVRVETAREMLAAVDAALPADVGVMAAAVADWRAATASSGKIKKDGSGAVPPLELAENPDILASVGHHQTLRPRLVVGFAAETSDVVENARAKLARKGADLIVANDVSPERGVMGGDANTVFLVAPDGVTDWPTLPKEEVARRLVAEIAQRLSSLSGGSA